MRVAYSQHSMTKVQDARARAGRMRAVVEGLRRCRALVVVVILAIV